MSAAFRRNFKTRAVTYIYYTYKLQHERLLPRLFHFYNFIVYIVMTSAATTSTITTDAEAPVRVKRAKTKTELEFSKVPVSETRRSQQQQQQQQQHVKRPPRTSLSRSTSVRKKKHLIEALFDGLRFGGQLDLALVARRVVKESENLVHVAAIRGKIDSKNRYIRVLDIPRGICFFVDVMPSPLLLLRTIEHPSSS
uniref:Uncharacterized protein n=1 Tax=Trichogramma kaykai TaxID=54128 RepID=A0ABD2W467_9HYME